ncbi:ATP-binding protein [Methanolobus sp. WCC5]|uniref:ATP-binding protein n=1 Tax=Methanolobus sp. WCC5 TaxID=3125785 RepID=UPI00324AB53A
MWVNRGDVVTGEGYRILFEKALSGIAILKAISDEKGKIVGSVLLEANEAFEKHTGLKTSRIPGKKISEIIPGIEDTSLTETFRKVMLTGQPASFEEYIPFLEKYYSIEIYMLDRDTFTIVLQDITDPKQAEEQIRASELQFRTLFQNANDTSLQNIASDFIRHKKAEDTQRVSGERLAKINDCLLGLRTDYEANMDILTALCGELLSGTCAIYNRLNGSMLCSVGQWNTPADYVAEDHPQGHICYDVIESAKSEPFIMRHLGETSYAQTDPNVASYGLQTYIGHPVMCRNEIVGSLCVVYQDDVDFSDDDIRIIGIIASAIGREEERKLVEEELHKSEQQLSNALNIAKLGHWEFDFTTGLFTFTDEFYAIFHTTAEEMGGYRMSLEDYSGRFVHPDDRHVVVEETCKTLQTDDPNFNRYLEHRMLYADGSTGYMAVRFFIVKDSKGKTIRSYGVNQDITDRKRVEEALRESNNRLESFLQISQRITLSVEQDELMQAIVDNATRATGIGSAAVYLLTDNDKIYLAATTPALPDDFPDKYRLASLNEHPHIKEAITSARHVIMSDSKTAKLTPAEQEIVQMRDLHSNLYLPIRLRGHSIGVLILSATEKKYTFTEEEIFLLQGFANQAAQVFENVSNYNRTKEHAKELEQEIVERRQAEEALLKAKEAAEAANMAKSEFLAIMSHELRTPLNAVIGFNEILQDTKLNEEQRHYTEIIQKSGRTLLDTIEDVLDFSKIEADKLELEILDFNLSDLLEGFADTMTLRAHNKGLELSYNIEPDVPAMLCGDPGRLLQILTNLAGNAIKFTSRGEVAINVSVRSQENNNVLLHFLVKDTGIGIPDEKIGYIFEKFTQADTSNTRRFGGTGLGLAISKRLVQMMGGDIGVTSEVEKGSEFWFTVRMKEQSKTLPFDRPNQVCSHQKHNHDLMILLVEDDMFNQEVAREMLVKLGYNPDLVQNGQEAIKALEVMPYDLVFMDVHMPVMDGLEATRHIRDPESGVLNNDIPIIALTAHAMQGDRERFIEAGMDDYISKPITLKAFEELLDMWNDIILKNREANHH